MSVTGLNMDTIRMENFSGHYVLGKFLALIDDGRTDKETGEHKTRYRLGVKVYSADKYGDVNSVTVDVSVRDENVAAIRACEGELKGRFVMIAVAHRLWEFGGRAGVNIQWLPETKIIEVPPDIFTRAPLRAGSVAVPVEKQNAANAAAKV